MANLFRYMNTAYERIEKETKDALQARSHSPAFADACSEYFGENFEITNESQNLKDLLTWLHQDTVQSLIQRLIGGEYIENCMEADKKELSQKPNLEDKLTPRFPEDNKIQKEEDPAQSPVRGKLYDINKKKAERKKRQKARLASNSQVEVSNEATTLSQGAQEQSLVPLEEYAGPSSEYDHVVHKSQTLTVTDNISKANATVSKGPADADIPKDGITPSTTAIEVPLKGDNTLPVNREQAPQPITLSPDISLLASNHATATLTQHPLDQDTSYQYEDYHNFNTGTAGDDKWTEVKGSRRKPKKSDQSSVNAHVANFSPAKGTPGVTRRVNNQNEREKLSAQLTQTTTPLQKGRAFSNSSPFASGSRSSSSKVPASTPIAPSPVIKNPWSKKVATPFVVPEKSVPSYKQALEKKPISAEKPAGSEKQHSSKKLIGVKKPTGPDKQPITKKPVSEEKPIGSEQQARTEKPHDSEKPVGLDQQTIRQVPTVKENIADPANSASQENPTSSGDKATPQTPSTLEEQVVVTQKTVTSQKTVVSKKTVVTQKTVITEKTVISHRPVVPEQPTLSEDLPSRSVDPQTTSEGKSDSTPTDLEPVAVKEPLVSTASVGKVKCDAKVRSSPTATESIDPGTGPNFKFLKPFSKKAKRAKIYENMAPTRKALFADKAPNNTYSLIESLRHAGVEDNALTSLAPRFSAMTATTTYLPLPNVEAAQRRAFPGRFLDVGRANNHSTSAGNSPLPGQQNQPVVYHYPPPDVLTPENQEILDRILKGPPYPKYPRVPKAPGQEDVQLLPAEFATKKIAVTTYDGKDIYDVLGDLCPVQLTIKDHPDVNKCIRQGQIFHCAYCKAEVSGTAAPEEGIICPGCGPCSDVRYCRRGHLLADSMDHFKVCGKKADTYPLQWSELPLHYQKLYPYIKPTTGTLTMHCFRQMAHCLIVNSDGVIQHPYKAYYANKMPTDDRVITFDWVKAMYPFQDQGHYYLFHPSKIAAGIDIDMVICMPNGSDDTFREDQRFSRVRNAAFLTHNQSLLCVLYRRLQDTLLHKPDLSGDRLAHRLLWLATQFGQEFPGFRAQLVAPLHDQYSFQSDWNHVRNLVADLELANPVLRAWITEDEEDDCVPVDPTVRWQGKHWGVVIDGPTFRPGSADRREWGPGWYGGGLWVEGDEQVWMMELNRKYFNMVLGELAKVEMERDGDII